MRMIISAITFAACLSTTVVYGEEANAPRNAGKTRPLRVVIIGDSTVADFSPGDPMRGWGQLIGSNLSSNILVKNFAANGRSSKTFIEEGLWRQALAVCSTGDCVLIQFGHNDAHDKSRPQATDPSTTYKTFLARYVDETRGRGGIPVLITPMHRRMFDAGGKVTQELKPYADAMKEVASEKKVDLVDLHALSGEMFEKKGLAGSGYLMARSEDNTHFSAAGARALAALIVEDIAARGIQPLAAYVAPANKPAASAPGATSANLALKQTVTASSFQKDWEPDRLVDGDLATAYSSAGIPIGNAGDFENVSQWVCIDLGRETPVARVDLFPRTDAPNVGLAFPVDLNIRISTDKVKWTTVITRKNYPRPDDANGEVFRFPAQPARYVKIDTGHPASDGTFFRVQMSEIRVFADEGPAVPPPPASTNVFPSVSAIATVGEGWTGEVVYVSTEGCAAWHVVIGDADNTGRNSILFGGCPDSDLELVQRIDGKWRHRRLGSRFATWYPGLTKNIRIEDLNNDGKKEIILGTGNDGIGDAKVYVLQATQNGVMKNISQQTGNDNSKYTHNFGIADVNGDGLKEIFSAYCGSGENFRYNIDSNLTAVSRTKIYQNSGSGEDAMLADVDNDGKLEYVESDCYRTDAAHVRIFKLDPSGNLILPPLTISGYDGHPAFQCTSMAADIDGDGKLELVIQWAWHQANGMKGAGTIIAYKIADGSAKPFLTVANEDPDLGIGYCENNVYWTDCDRDGRSELYVSTRGGARVMRFDIAPGTLAVTKNKVIQFTYPTATSCWMNAGDVDGDGRNEIVVASGNENNRTARGTSYVVVLRRTGRQ